MCIVLVVHICSIVLFLVLFIFTKYGTDERSHYMAQSRSIYLCIGDCMATALVMKLMGSSWYLEILIGIGMEKGGDSVGMRITDLATFLYVSNFLVFCIST